MTRNNDPRSICRTWWLMAQEHEGVKAKKNARSQPCTLSIFQFKPKGLVKESKEPAFRKVDECVIKREEKEKEWMGRAGLLSMAEGGDWQNPPWKKQLESWIKLIKQSFQQSGNWPKAQNNLKSIYALKTVDLWVRTMRICGILAWGHTCSSPSRWRFNDWKIQFGWDWLWGLAVSLLKLRGLIRFGVVGNALTQQHCQRKGRWASGEDQWLY